MAMAMRKRSGSGSKRHLKEKVVQIYESFFRGEDLTTDNPTFWDEFFLLNPKVPQLEMEISRLTADQLTNSGSISLLFQQCVEAIGLEHHIRRVYALQTVSALLGALYTKMMQEPTLNIRSVLVRPDGDEMSRLIAHCHTILSEEVPESLKSLVLKLLLVIATGTPNPDSNPLLEDLMLSSLFEPLVRLLSQSTRQQHGYDVVVLLTFLVNYKKYESTNPFTVKLSILDDELALNGYGQVIRCALAERSARTEADAGGGWLASLSGVLGGILLGGDEQPQCGAGGEEIMLLALYEAAHLNRNFMTTLAHSTAPSAPPSPPATLPPHESPPNAASIQALDNDQPTNLLVAFFQYCSIVMADIRSEASCNKLRLCFITLTCIAEEQFANSIMHDQNLSFKVQLHRRPMRHRKLVLEEPPSQPLAATLIDLLIEFIMSHLMKKMPGELYELAVGILQRLLAYQKRWRVRLARDWRQLWAALIALLKYLASNDSHLLKRLNIFTLALQVVNIFNVFITFGDTFLPTPASYDQLYYELIREVQVFDVLAHMALRYSTSDGEHKAAAQRLANGLVNVRAINQHFSPKIEKWLLEQSVSTPTQDQILEVVRANYDSLILKLQENLEDYERYSEKEDAELLNKLRREAAAGVRADLKLAANQHTADLLTHYSSIA